MVILMIRMASLVFVLGCATRVSPQPVGLAAPVGHAVPNPEPTIQSECPTGHRAKIKMKRGTSCANDGSVEFCISDSAVVKARIAAVSPAIRCSPGGGQAQCMNAPGLLLCSYPTRTPDHCTAKHGAMTEAVWSDMCQLAALFDVREIVPTWFE
jgi:hypothetical protein